ncbi:MAG: MarR family winged helix-turn-helix transcriptional regulator [Sulfitobacter sp.]
MKPHELPTRAEDMFCYGIYVASHVVNRAYTPHLARLGLTYPQYITLTLLWEKDGQKVSELAEALRMETSTVTPLLKRLETQGYVRRNPDDKDRRAVLINLTDHGRALQRDAPDITACMVDGTTLSQSELKTLQQLLLGLTDGLMQSKLP